MGRVTPCYVQASRDSSFPIRSGRVGTGSVGLVTSGCVGSFQIMRVPSFHVTFGKVVSFQSGRTVLFRFGRCKFRV